jgi:hypothetical protein
LSSFELAYAQLGIRKQQQLAASVAANSEANGAS